MDPQKQKVPQTRHSAESWWAFAISVQRDAAGAHLRVAWVRLGFHLVVFAVGAWLAMATGAFLWVKYYRGFADADPLDIALPSRWSQYAGARGNFYIKQAKQELTEQKWVEALYHLRVGVAAAPANTEGRLILAQFFTLSGRIELAQRTLLDGLPYAAEDNDYLKTVFSFLLQYQADDEVRRVAATVLGADNQPAARVQLAAIAAATAHFYRGNYDAAESLIREHNLLETKDGRVLLIRIEWERGDRETAIARLKANIAEFPEEEVFYAQLSACYRALGDFSSAERYALLREIGHPQSASARIDLLAAYRLGRHSQLYQTSVEGMLRDFAEDRAALLSLANFGAEQGDAALALRTYRLLQEKGLEADPAALMVAEAHIVARDYRAALDFLLSTGTARPEWRQKFLGLVNALEAVAYFGLAQTGDGDLYFNHFLAQPTLRAEHLAAIANRLIEVGAKPQARLALAKAAAADPRNQHALTRLIELDLEAGPSVELMANLRRLLAMRRPSPTVLAQARKALAGDRFLFSAEREELLAAVQAALALAPAEPLKPGGSARSASL